MQTLIFKAARDVYDQVNYDWKSKVNKDFALQQMFYIIETFLNSDKFRIEPKSFQEDEARRKMAIMIGMEQIVGKILSDITHQNTTELAVRYKNTKYRSTKDAIEWRTAKKTMRFRKTHINLCVVDSAWEAAHVRELDRNRDVTAWVKNDHLGFEIPYVHRGARHTYIPDFIVKMTNGEHLILEVKGQQKDKDESKWKAMETWTKAVSQHQENGEWHFAVSQDPAGQRVHQIVARLVQTSKAS